MYSSFSEFSALSLELLEIRVEMAPNLWLAGLEIQGEGGGEGKCRSLQELALELGVQDSG